MLTRNNAESFSWQSFSKIYLKHCNAVMNEQAKSKQVQTHPETATLPADVDRVRLVYSGKDYFDLLLKLIERARFIIHLQVYIIEDDYIGHTIVQALCHAASRGVRVYFVADGYGSQHIGNKLISDMRQAGVCFRMFEPVFRSHRFYFGRRLHHKVFVADGCQALVGGINISDKYYDSKDGPTWFDVALYVCGKTAAVLERICCNIWNRSGETPAKTAPHSLSSQDAGVFLTVAAVKVRRNDWIRKQMYIWESYASLFANAQKEIIIVCSYFLPGWKFRRMMAVAVNRGVAVKIVVAGPSDVMIAKHAERYLYRWMLQHDVRVFEYQKSILHAKLALADGENMTIGSYNVNNISTYASVELNLDVTGAGFVSSVRDTVASLMQQDCLEITLPLYAEKNNWIERLWQRCCYEIIKMMLYLFTFYFRQEKEY